MDSPVGLRFVHYVQLWVLVNYYILSSSVPYRSAFVYHLYIAFHEVAIGNGPVNAVDSALRKALTKIYPSLNSVGLVDYKVRIIDSGSGTEATTRVLIECEDENNERWRSVGLSTNIIDASVMALYDSLTWRLLSLGVKPVAPAH